jgi:peptidyl-prolyl cis-trans isomerase SurA
MRTWVLVLVGAVGTARGAEVVDRVAAVVNGQIVLLSEVEQRAAPLQAHVFSDRDRERARDAALDQLIAEKLMDAQIKELQIEVSSAEMDQSITEVKKQNAIDDEQFAAALLQQGMTERQYRDQLKSMLAKRKLVEFVVRPRVRVSDEDVKGEYDRMVQALGSEPEVRARHILVSAKEGAPEAEVAAARARAEELLKRAQGGEDFVALAKASSEAPNREDGGDLGWFKKGAMLADIEAAAFGAKKGDVVGPVRSPFGWHVLKVEDTRSTRARPFDQAAPELRERLYREALEKATEQYLVELRRSAAVEVKLTK